MILKGLTAPIVFDAEAGIGDGARFPSRLRARQKADGTTSHKKENAATWLPQRSVYLVVPEMIIAKFGLDSTEKKNRKLKIMQRRRVR